MFNIFRKDKNEVYMDFASKTPVDDSIQKYVNSLEKLLVGNSSSVHSLGVESNRYLNEARANVANIFGAHSDEIIFTRGGTESDNMAVLGAVFAYRSNKDNESKIPHIVVGALEHPAVIKTVKYLEKNNYASVSVLPVNKEGVVDISLLSKTLTPETILVSVQYVNGEIGTIQPIKEITQIIRRYKKKIYGDRFSSYPLIHTDAAQAIGIGLDLSVVSLGVDLLSANGSKIYGPTSTGILYKKRNIPLEPIFFGGDQEFGFRPGTAPVPLISGFSKALSFMVNDIPSVKKNREIRDYFISQLLKIVRSLSLSDRVSISGSNLSEKSSPNIVHIVVRGVESDYLVLGLDASGVYVSSQTACKSSKSHSDVMKDIFNLTETDGTLRFSFGKSTRKKDVDYVISTFSKILEGIVALEKSLIV